MHLVSSDGVTGAAQQALFMPMMTRMPKARVKMLVVSLSPNAVPGAVLRQSGVPVYDVALSKRRFSMGAFAQLTKTVQAFKPDVIQAWGHTAEIVSTWLHKRCEGDVKLVWSVAATAPLGRKPGLIDRQKLKYAAKFSKRAHKIVYTSEAAASAHRRAGFPEDGHAVIPLGVDPTRFKPDFAARRKVREQLGLGPEAFVIGMMAPFQPEFDHPTLLKAVGELIKTNPNVSVLLAGHGVQKGNAPLMALVGGGTLGTRTQLLGEWSDHAAFFNACDLACSSALTDTGRMSLVVAMLCGVPCVATGMGAQGEVIGQFGVAVEPGSAAALIRGITRVMQLTPERRVFMAQGARKHALANFVSIRSLQKYLQVYYDLVGRKLVAATAVPTPEIDATIPTPSAEEQAAAKASVKPKANKTVDLYELRDPDSLESRDLPTPEERAAKTASEGDVLNLFESSMAKQKASGTSPMSERARGVAEVEEDLLAPELLASGADAKPALAPVPASLTPIAATPISMFAPIATQELTLAKDEPKSVAPSMPEAKAVSVAKPADAPVRTQPQLAPEPAKVELTLADTMSLSIQMSSTSMTGTLEIPPDLIFMSQAVTSAPKPTPAATAPRTPVATTPAATVPAAPVVTKPVVAAPASSAAAPPADAVLVIPVETVPAAVPLAIPVEPTPATVAAPIAPSIVPMVAEVAFGSGLELPTDIESKGDSAGVSLDEPNFLVAVSAAPAVMAEIAAPVRDESTANVTADSSTVPALAVDALLTNAMDASLPIVPAATEKEAIQLDLLGEPIVDQQRVVGT